MDKGFEGFEEFEEFEGFEGSGMFGGFGPSTSSILLHSSFFLRWLSGAETTISFALSLY